MKKVLVFALVLSLVLGSFTFAFAADFDDTVGTDCEEAVNVLTDLGVVTGYPDGTYQPEGIVTRAEMAKLLIVALGMEDYVKGAYSSFSDVAGSHWATSYIAYASSLGIIEGYPDGTFKPDKTVTYQEAATMIVRALGYQDQYLTGVWPASHVSMALTLGVLDGIVATADGANRGDIAIMLYQALSCALVNYDSNGNMIRGDMMLSRLGAEAVNPDEKGNSMPVVITKAMADDAVIDLNDYIGAFASVYVNEDGDVIVLAEVASEYLVGEFDESDTEFTLDDGTVYTLKSRADNTWPQYNLETLTTAGVVKTATAAQGFYNGAQVTAKVADVATDWAAADDDAFVLAAKISGNYITDIYSIAQWEANAEVLWDADFADELADDDAIDGWDFDLTDDDEVDMDAFILAGADSLDAIDNDSVVTVYANTDDTTKSPLITKVAVSTDTVSGKITKTNSAVDEFTIDSTVYVTSDLYSDSALKLGDEGTYYLNMDGDIAFYDADDYAGNYAIVIQAAQDDQNYGSSTVKQHYLLNKAGDDVVYNYKNASTYTGATLTDTPKQLVEIDTNKDGKLTSIRDKATTDAAGGKLTASGILAGKLVSDDVVVFDVTAVDTDDWFVGTIADVKDDYTFQANELLYGVNADGKVDVVVILADAASDTTTNFGFFTSWNNGYNADDDAIHTGKALVDGAAVDYATTDATTITTTQLAAYNQLYVLTYDGDAIDTVKNAAITPIDVVPSTFANNVDGYSYNSTLQTSKTLGASLDEFNLIVARSGDRVDVGIAEVTSGGAITTAANPDYQLIAGADVYKVKLNDSNAFSKLEVGTLSAVKKDCYVMLLQLDEDSDNWDTVIYVTKADAAKLTW